MKALGKTLSYGEGARPLPGGEAPAKLPLGVPLAEMMCTQRRTANGTNL